MKKFSRKEKAALVIFGLILLVIIIQVMWRINIFECGLETIIPIEAEEVDTSANLLKLPGVVLTSSSHNDSTSTVDKLIDGNPRSLWHVALDQVGEPAWVTVDFSEGNARIVRTLAALPREDIPRQFFRTALFLGSNDGETWEPVSEIALPARPSRARWSQ